MSETLVIGIIADTSNPAAATRLLRDLAELTAADPGLARAEVVVLENPSDKPAPRAGEELRSSCLDITYVDRASQERDAARGCLGTAALPAGRLPIAFARTLLQRRIAARAVGKRAAVWILDEDLCLSPLLDGMAKGALTLSERIRRLRAAGVDVAVCPTLGAPPVPARSTARVNIEDIARHLEIVASLHPEAPWPDFSAENERVRRALPEYYYDLSRAHDDAGAHPMWLERADRGELVRAAFARLASATAGLIHGMPVTRAIHQRPELDIPRAQLARGGSTLVLKPALLSRIPNVAPRIGPAGRVSRRSDMLWARLAATLEGAIFAQANIPLLQDRSGPGRSSFDADKLMDDARGSALVLALDALIDEGALTTSRPLSQGAALRASAIYAARLQERIAAIHRSEERAKSLLEQILSRVRGPRDRSGHLFHPDHAASIERLALGLSALRDAYALPPEPCDPAAEQIDVERFFLRLSDEIEAHRSR